MPARPPRARGAKAKERRKRIPRRGERRGTGADEAPVAADDASVAETAARVRGAGGSVIGAYRDPLGGAPLVLAVLPLASIAPTPFQRELSPAHVRRLVERIEQSGVFLDPVIAVADPTGSRFWTPNGRHRLAAADALGLRSIAALVSADPQLAFRILALNTEKAHNLRDRSLEVIRMARALVADRRSGKESDYAAEFESPALLTLGILYERDKRFSGSAYLPLLRKVDRFAATSLGTSLRGREGVAARIAEIDVRVAAIVERLKARGFRSPFLRTFVVARINPVRWIKVRSTGDGRPPMALGAALTRMARSVRQFDVDEVKPSDLAMIAAVAPPDAE
jgi:ParB family transcriptional regulator, chromosome partitioning protein